MDYKQKAEEIKKNTVSINEIIIGQIENEF